MNRKSFITTILALLIPIKKKRDPRIEWCIRSAKRIANYMPENSLDQAMLAEVIESRMLASQCGFYYSHE